MGLLTHTAGEEQYKDRFVVGYVEPVTITAPSGERQRWLARVDSGATRSSIDKLLVEEMQLGPSVGTVTIRNANGRMEREVIRVKLKLADEEFEEEFTVADRSQMTFKVLLGRNILNQNFLIDPKKITSGEEE